MARRRIPASDRDQLTPALFWLNSVVSWTNIVAQVGNAAFQLDYGAGVFIVGLASILLLGATTFAAMVVQIVRSAG
jgi:hypothetical protein